MVLSDPRANTGPTEETNRREVNKGSMNAFEVLGEEIAVAENTQDLAVEQDITQKTDQNTQPQIPTSIDDHLIDPSFRKDAEGDEEMALTEIGTEDLDLSDIL